MIFTQDHYQKFQELRISHLLPITFFDDGGVASIAHENGGLGRHGDVVIGIADGPGEAETVWSSW